MATCVSVPSVPPQYARLPASGFPQPVLIDPVNPPDVNAALGTTLHVAPPSVEISTVPPS
jgi:hypothetical protein